MAEYLDFEGLANFKHKLVSSLTFNVEDALIDAGFITDEAVEEGSDVPPKEDPYFPYGAARLRKATDPTYGL